MMVMFNKILVAVDGSRYSNDAVDVAIDLTKCYQASVILLHVIRNLSLPQEIMDMMAKGEVKESRMELLQDSAEIILDNAQEKFKQAGFWDVKSEYIIGSPASTIAGFAEENKVDLIIIGHRGVSSEGDELLGGVVRKLTNISKISCLIVK
jgi:nucleotide-binding universal stress UspA family protein